MDTPELEFRQEDLASTVATALIGALNAELTERYPEDGANHFRLDQEEVAVGRGAFLVCYRNGQPVACGAIRRLGEDVAEVKRMFVEPGSRGRGIGRRLLTVLEGEARRLGVKRLVLETGVRQPEALTLYARAGFVRVPAFGEYSGSSLSVCLAKEL